VTTGTRAYDQLEVSATPDTGGNPVFKVLNGLLGAAWSAYIQHQTNIALIAARGLHSLADSMQRRIADEPVTVRALLDRLIDLDGTPTFSVETPVIGVTVRQILDIDMGLQRHTRPMLNAAAEAVGAAHDATTRNLIEQILEEEEQHLSWLATEIALYDTLGESLYSASRLRSGPTSST
jgi:bacterioferritin